MFIHLTDRVSVAPQITADDVERAKTEGFTHILCNRPDGEVPGQPTMAEIEDAAQKQGLAFSAIPIGPAGISPDDISAAADVFGSGEHVLAYCRSGTRSTTLHALTRVVGGEDVDRVIDEAADAGYDLSSMRTAFETLAGQ